MPWVLDASIAMAWCFEDERTDATEALLDRLDTDPSVVPQLWHLEVANVLTVAMRKRPKPRITEAERAQFLQMLAGAPIRVDAETQTHAWQSSLSLADQHRLTVYDAAYLELALRLGTPLASLDRELRAAAKRLGVALLP